MKKLVGQGKPFHSAVDKAAGLLKRKVGTGAEFMKELMGITGIKPTEIQERGLNEIMGMPKMTHEQFMAALASKPAPAIEEKVFANKLLRNPGADPDPHHEQYTLPGGENYREMLIKAPKGVDNQEKIMELEAKIRHTPMFNSTPQQQADIAKYYNQIKELKAQEAASPKPFPGVYHHFGGEPGILASMRLKDRTGPNGEKLLHLEELQSDWHQQGREHGYELNNEEQQKQFAGWPGVPDAPFKKNWEEMALKRLIHHAAEKGYHGIVVTPGKEQADRYSLAKYIDSIMLVPNPHPNANSRPYYYKAFNKQGDRVADDTVDEQSLAQHIGKEAAEKLLSQEPNPMGERMISGANLVTGDEGMKGFYDKKVPNILNSIGKKYGVKTHLHGHQMNIHHDLEGYMPRDQMEIKNLHHFPITEEMRKDVLANGLPLYAGGGEVDAEEVFMGKGGKVKELEQYLRDREGDYGLKRLQRAADEIPGLENMYTLQALKEAFGGDNAKALMTMNPADFEKFAVRLFPDPDTREEEMEERIERGHGLPPMSHHEYIKHLAKIKGGFADVPFLEVNKRPKYLPNISGHEGRHRSRAMMVKGAQKSLVRLLPSPSMRESMPRRHREDFIEAMKKELGEKRLVTGEGRSLLPADLEAPEHKNIERRNMLGGRPQLPEIYKDGGDVDAESYFFPNKE